MLFNKDGSFKMTYDDPNYVEKSCWRNGEFHPFPPAAWSKKKSWAEEAGDNIGWSDPSEDKIIESLAKDIGYQEQAEDQSFLSSIKKLFKSLF